MIRILTLSLLIVLAGLSQAWAEKVNVNNADAATMAKSIKGIGLKKAEAIVAYRKKHGQFKSLEDLQKVKGIGKKLLEKNREVILVGAANKAKRRR